MFKAFLNHIEQHDIFGPDSICKDYIYLVCNLLSIIGIILKILQENVCCVRNAYKLLDNTEANLTYGKDFVS